MNAPQFIAIIAVALIAGLTARHLVLKRFSPAPRPRKQPFPGKAMENRKKTLRQVLRKAGEMVQAEDEEMSEIRLELLRAGLHIDPITWRGIQLASMLVAILLVTCILLAAHLNATLTPICISLCLATGYFGPKLFLSSRKRERTRSIRAALPSALELLNTATQAGYSIERGIRLVANTTKGPLAQEFHRIDQEVNLLGIPLDKSLQRMKTRCDTPSISSFVNAMVQAHTQGTSIGRVLDAQARSVRSQHYADTLVVINRLPNKMVPVIFIFFFPPIIALAVTPVIYNAIQLLSGLA